MTYKELYEKAAVMLDRGEITLGDFNKMVKPLDVEIHPEPKRGRWILDRSGAYCCSECMEPCAGYVMMKPRDKFCKMCGSYNGGENDNRE